MDTKFEFRGTPGPWVFDSINFKIKGSGDIEGMTVIADLSPRMDYSRGKWTQYMNALLISKAPDMFEMLNKCLKCFEALNTDSPMCRGIEQLLKQATES